MAMEQILAIVILGMTAVVLIVCWLPACIKPNWEEYKNNKMPIVEVKATVYETEVVLGEVVKTLQGVKNQRYLIATFHTSNNLTVVLQVPDSQIPKVKDGVHGTLVYQGKKFYSFTPDGENE